MTQILEAVYENGVFRPLQVPNLSEGQVVQLVVSSNPNPEAARRIRRFRGILHKSNDDRSLVDELIEERREEAARE